MEEPSIWDVSEFDSSSGLNVENDHRMEDVFQGIIKRFSTESEFKKFAVSSAGLALSQYIVDTISDDNPNSVEQRKLKMLHYWKQMQARPEPLTIKDIVENYFSKMKNDDEGTNSADEDLDESSGSVLRRRRVPPDYADGQGIQPIATEHSHPESTAGDFYNDQPERFPAPRISRSVGGIRFTSNFDCGNNLVWVIVFLLIVITFLIMRTPEQPLQRSDCGYEPECKNFEKNYLSFKTKLNFAARKAASESGIVELKKPNFSVYPETVVVNFYNTPAQKQGYVPEISFNQQTTKLEGQSIDMGDIFRGVEGRATRYVALVGGVGYGKTEMLKRITLDVLEKSNSHLEEVETVHFVNFRDLWEEEKLSPTHLLFKGVNLSDEELQCGAEFILRNPRKFLLVIDGVDQYPEKLGKCARLTNFPQKTNATKILNSLLSGNVFPEVRLLISSREHAIRHFENVARPDKVVALSGFSLGSIEMLVRVFGETDGDRIWSHLETHSPTLLSLSSIPMFLVFSVLALKERKENPPETLTEVLMLVLNYHVSSEHVDCSIISVISKLKSMSFHGLERGEVTFTVSDLPDGLKIDDVQDLLITLNGIKALNHKFLDGHFRFHFCHQSLQEALTALHVAEMPLAEFEKFVKNEIHKPKWMIVRRLVCGLLLNEKTHEIAKGNDPTVSLLNLSSTNEFDLKQKQKILKKSLQNKLEVLQGDGKLRQDLLELFHAMHESEEGVKEIVMSALHEINFLNIPLTQSDFHVLLSTVRHCPRLMLLNLINCKLTSDRLQMLVRTFRNSKCNAKIRILLLGNYENNMPADGAIAVRNMIPFVTDLLWLGYRIESSDIEMLQKKMNENKELTIVCWNKDTKKMIMLKREDKKNEE